MLYKRMTEIEQIIKKVPLSRKDTKSERLK